VDDQDDDGDHEQNVNQSSGGLEGQPTEEPQYDENDEQDHEHQRLLSLSGERLVPVSTLGTVIPPA